MKYSFKEHWPYQLLIIKTVNQEFVIKYLHTLNERYMINKLV
ncbi:MAG: hypothetical protein ACJAWA_000162 [Nonlabens sp.]|jgi:hypothetical protein